jgi:hypothetical protein
VIPLFKVHTINVETFTGPTPTGDGYAAPVPVHGYLDEGLVRIRDGNGEQLIEQSRFYAEVADVAKFTPESRVTLPDGRVSQVDRTRTREAGGAFVLVQHIEVVLK